jgi:antitoxin YefM
MQVISYTQARKSLEAVIAQVIEDQEPAMIRRREGGNVVLLPEQTYNSMQETLLLLSTTANAQRLLRSVNKLNAGKTKDRCTASFTKQTNQL